MGVIEFADNLECLRGFEGGSIPLIYVDPPFNTGRKQSLARLSAARDAGGDRTGFGGHRYRTTTGPTRSFGDRFDDYMAFLEPRLREAHRVLRPDGSFFLHVDPRESHYCKVLLDEIFGRASFLNEIIWAYDFGGRSNRRWAAKHDTILWYAKDPENYTFNGDAVDRIPYMAPGLVSEEKRSRGKKPTDTWWHTIVPTSGKERTGYPTQKPEGVLRRIVAVHSNPGDLVLDFFAGSGTTGFVAATLDRDFYLVDNNPEAIAVMQARLAPWNPEVRDASNEECDSGGPDAPVS